MYVPIQWLVTICLFFSFGVHAQTALELDDAERRALTVDPGSKRFGAMAQAMREKSVSDGELPDPQVKFGLLNFPTDTFQRDQEPMTQIQLGLQQMFPRGDSLQIKQQQTEIMAQQYRHRSQNRERMIRQQVRLKWLEMYYWSQASRVIKEKRSLFEQMVEVTEYQYSAGRRNQQDVIQAELELNKLEDRLINIQTRLEKQGADLSVLVDLNPGQISLPGSLPTLAVAADLQQLETTMRNHPLLQVASAQIEEGQQGVALAREAYKPGWMLGVNYGIRDGQNPNGDDRPDFLSIGVTVDVPLFRKKRQDRRLAASQHQLSAKRSQFDQQYLELKSQLRQNYAEWQRLEQRIATYQNVLIPQAVQNTEAALFAYQSSRAEFSSLVRASITELETTLQAIRLNVDRIKSKARLRYLVGEPS